MSQPTIATFRLPRSSKEPLELTVQMPALAMAIVHPDGLGALEGKWAGAIGVYVLLGSCDDGKHEYRAYVGKSETGGLKERLTTHRNSPSWQSRHGLPRDWWRRGLLVRSRDEDGFNSAEAGWLEGRLWDILDNAPAALLVGKKGRDETLPKHQRDVLDQYLPPITAVLRAVGASPDTPDQESEPSKKTKRKHNATVADLLEAGLIAAATRLRSISSMHEAIAYVQPDGKLRVGGIDHDSPSGAAVAVVGHEMNGWTFWGVPSGDGSLLPLSELRKRLEPEVPANAAPLDEAVEVEPTTTEQPTAAKSSALKPGALKPLLDAGLLAAGGTLRGKRKGIEHTATVESDGRVRLADGSIHESPSGAGVQVVGHNTNGWLFWRVERDGALIPLKTLRAEAK